MTLPTLIIFVIMGVYLLYLEKKVHKLENHLTTLASHYLELIEVLDAKNIIKAVYEGGDHE